MGAPLKLWTRFFIDPPGRLAQPVAGLRMFSILLQTPRVLFQLTEERTMRKKTAGMPVLAIFLGIAIGAVGSQAISSAKPQIARTELMTIELADIPGKVAHVYTMELAPGLMTPRHRHPGHYLVYVLSGTGVVEEDDKPTLHLKPGVSYYIHAPSASAESWHAVWNTSTTEPLKTLVVLINDKGQPGTVFDK